MNNESKSIPIPFVVLAVYIIAVIVAAAYCVTTLSIPVVGTCMFLVLEALLAALLRTVPKPLHVAVIAAQVIAGIYFKKVIFTAVMAAVYVAALILMSAWMKDYD